MTRITSILTVLSFLLIGNFLFFACSDSESSAAFPERTDNSAGTEVSNWPQWGGSNRDFIITAPKLAESWPESGPSTVWRRQLGEGYSSVTVMNGQLFTMYRTGESEVAVSVDVKTGKTLWENTYSAPADRLDRQYGPGPHATPLVVDNQIFTIGATGVLLAMDAETGKTRWRHQLLNEFDGKRSDPIPFENQVLLRGYASSPIAYKETIIVTTGGELHSVRAYDRQNGALVWNNGDFTNNSHASPLLIEVDGTEQLIAFMTEKIVGLDPGSGDLLWEHPHKTPYGMNIATPVWGEDNLLFYSSAYGTGSKGLRLTTDATKPEAREVWANKKMRIHFSNAVRVGDTVYGSSGDFGTVLFTAISAKTGEILWRSREIGRATLIYADDKLIFLDENGTLGLASILSDGVKIHSTVQILEGPYAWTPPTLVGNRLYLRDRKNLVALELPLSQSTAK